MTKPQKIEGGKTPMKDKSKVYVFSNRINSNLLCVGIFSLGKVDSIRWNTDLGAFYFKKSFLNNIPSYIDYGMVEMDKEFFLLNLPQPTLEQSIWGD